MELHQRIDGPRADDQRRQGRDRQERPEDRDIAADAAGFGPPCIRPADILSVRIYQLLAHSRFTPPSWIIGMVLRYTVTRHFDLDQAPL